MYQVLLLTYVVECCFVALQNCCDEMFIYVLNKNKQENWWNEVQSDIYPQHNSRDFGAEALCVQRSANWSSSVFKTDNLQLAVASGFVLFWYDNIMTESRWNAHSSVKWEDVWLYVPVFLHTVCLHSCLSPPTVYLYYTLFPFSCLPLSGSRLFIPSSLLFFHCLQRAAFPCFYCSCFFVFSSRFQPLPWLFP